MRGKVRRRRTQESRRARILADLRWGIAQVMFTVALMLVPAALVFVVSGAVRDGNERDLFARIIGAYLLVALMGGVVLGLGRGVATGSRRGATAIGALIGAQTLLAGALISRTAGHRDGGLLLLFASVGAVTGAVVGASVSARAKVWAARARAVQRAP